MHILPGFRICVTLVYLYNEKACVYQITGINFFFLISGVPEIVLKCMVFGKKFCWVMIMEIVYFYSNAQLLSVHGEENWCRVIFRSSLQVINNSLQN